ncbi:hypothetical protein WJX84_011811 [Apatococcus fuscideae]|uniref:Uncharacterized protein n=1 Tax=Apatococcus fuscideae TaxID=2026836 RepID=A0AAW1THF1_9CHLO
MDPACSGAYHPNITHARLQHALIAYLPALLPATALTSLRATCTTMCALADAVPAEIWLEKGRQIAPRWAQPKLSHADDARTAQALLREQARVYAGTRWRRRLGSVGPAPHLGTSPITIRAAQPAKLRLPWPDSLCDETT